MAGHRKRKKPTGMNQVANILNLLIDCPVGDLLDKIKYNSGGIIKTADSFVKRASPKKIPDKITINKLRFLPSPALTLSNCLNCLFR